MTITLLLQTKRTSVKKNDELVSECLYLTDMPISLFSDELTVINYILGTLEHSGLSFVGSKGGISLISDYTTGTYSFSIALKGGNIPSELRFSLQS